MVNGYREIRFTVINKKAGISNWKYPPYDFRKKVLTIFF